MAGFFGLFSGKKNKYVDDPQPSNTQSSKQDAFFLSSDEAKTLGDIDFMRQSKKVRRTFPKTLSGKGAELVQEVSSLDKTKLNPNQISSSATKSESQSTPTQSTTTQPPRRSSGSDLDLFRQMAKQIKK